MCTEQINNWDKPVVPNFVPRSDVEVKFEELVRKMNAKRNEAIARIDPVLQELIVKGVEAFEKSFDINDDSEMGVLYSVLNTPIQGFNCNSSVIAEHVNEAISVNMILTIYCNQDKMIGTEYVNHRSELRPYGRGDERYPIVGYLYNPLSNAIQVKIACR